ncbi:hypothetical protein BLOT_007246 [Blomia tropicalis]|nr:hypothetical protein BLOT_007246 [Blomia tropicalis]
MIHIEPNSPSWLVSEYFAPDIRLVDSLPTMKTKTMKNFILAIYINHDNSNELCLPKWSHVHHWLDGLPRFLEF